MAHKSNQSTFHTRDWAHQSWVDQPTYGVLLKDVMEEAYWANVASRMKVGDHIDVQPEGLTWFASLLVIDCGPAFAKVKLLNFVDLTDKPAMPEQEALQSTVKLADKFVIERNAGWFRIKRTVDNEVVKSGFRRLADAEAWAADNLKVESAKSED